ncbi:MAG: TatD family hydrolase [Sediminibacterium sp.]|nr:TatD family hydrolase [Sediminibacterium sp.]
MSITLIDTHSHIYLDEFNDDLNHVFVRAEQNNVNKILLPSINKEHFDKQMKLTFTNSHCQSMIGLHPCYVKEDFQKELDFVHHSLNNKELNFIGIGEIGLDYFWDKTFLSQQKYCYETQLDWAIEYNLPVSIHSRDSTDDCFEAIKERSKKGLTGVFHCFSGTLVQAQKIMDSGFYLGIGGVVTFKNSHLINILQTIGIDKIVLETDAPYLAPVPFRGKRNEPSYLLNIVNFLSNHLSLQPEYIAQITTKNAQNLFRV